MLGIDVQFCHLTQRATPTEIVCISSLLAYSYLIVIDQVRNLEWVSGCLPSQLFLNSRFNMVPRQLITDKSFTL